MRLLRRLNGNEQHPRPIARGLLVAGFAVVLSAHGAPAAAGLVIIPDYTTTDGTAGSSTIAGDPNAATIEATINSAIQIYENLFTDPITVNIRFQELNSGLGMSSFNLFEIAYSSFRSQLVADAKTSNDATAVATLPNQTNNPVDGNPNMYFTLANLHAVGFTGGPSLDGTISLNTSIMNLSRSGAQVSSKYDLMAVASHEIDEILGMGSGLNPPDGPPEPRAQDLFRYSAPGVRSYDTNPSTVSYLSIDGGTTNLDNFNQSGSGDYGDWVVHNPAQVQDFQGTPGTQPNLGTAELTNLDVIGYDMTGTPEPDALTMLGAIALGASVYGLWRRKRGARVGTAVEPAGSSVGGEGPQFV